MLDPELMRRARQRKWVGAPDRMKPACPTTWIGSWRPDEETSEAEANFKIGYTWKYGEPANEEWLVRMMVAHLIIVGWAGQLLEIGRFDLLEGVLGIYCRLPMVDTTEQSLVCHCDVGPTGLNCAYSTPWERIHRLARHA